MVEDLIAVSIGQSSVASSAGSLLECLMVNNRLRTFC